MKVAILSDIHANRFALEAVLSDLDRAGVETILFAGDVVGYYYWPRQTIDRIVADGRFICIRGNHEDIFREYVADASCRDSYRKKYGSGYDVCLSELDAGHLAWLDQLPEQASVEIGGRRFFMRHGSLRSTDEYIYPDADAAKLLANHSGEDITIFGHTHYPFVHASGERLLLNPGSVGQPRDVGGLASYALVLTDTGVVQFRRRNFDKDAVAAAAKARDPELAYLWKILER
ncbi:metallophosphoesterase family protein [Sphingomonas sp. Root241]|uniref:metallophosphoesterase family protein n=1 Tax=Sphingomonas sp. Root241 TaxID=1736501 RepID=UPI0006FED372|nr:metallophosphoesterase family protein [Sphingomonas sp. Root241]KRC81718.1 hypothetical protein ASE13_04905 [Sphingomonas sp. Root241]